jgi:mono/diheme cytochrome c family protein
MISRTTRRVSTFTFFIAGVVGLFAIVGCAGTSGENAPGNTMQDNSKPGAQVWGESCARCHNIRPPASLTDAEWELAGLHMRVRANLTGDETRKVVEFLQMAN